MAKFEIKLSIFKIVEITVHDMKQNRNIYLNVQSSICALAMSTFYIDKGKNRNCEKRT